MSKIVADKRLLMICCTMRRPDRIKEMIKSYEMTKRSDLTDIVYCFDTTDPRLEEYGFLINDNNKYIVTHPNYQTKMFNVIAKDLHPDYDYYGLVNDDHVFRTDGWDTELVNTVEERGNGWGIAYANAMWYDSDIVCRHPSCFVYSNKIIKVLDYAIYPEFNHFKIDTHLRDLTESLGLLFYREDVVIEHMHRNVGKADDDETYQWGYCAEEQAWGARQLFLWTQFHADHDRAKIKNAMLRDGVVAKPYDAKVNDKVYSKENMFMTEEELAAVKQEMEESGDAEQKG